MIVSSYFNRIPRKEDRWCTGASSDTRGSRQRHPRARRSMTERHGRLKATNVPMMFLTLESKEGLTLKDQGFKWKFELGGHAHRSLASNDHSSATTFASKTTVAEEVSNSNLGEEHKKQRAR